jgi:hypothetical protein
MLAVVLNNFRGNKLSLRNIHVPDSFDLQELNFDWPCHDTLKELYLDKIDFEGPFDLFIERLAQFKILKNLSL